MLEEKLKKFILDVPNFLMEGVTFRDTISLFANAALCSEIVEAFCFQAEGKGRHRLLNGYLQFFFGLPIA